MVACLPSVPRGCRLERIPTFLDLLLSTERRRICMVDLSERYILCSVETWLRVRFGFRGIESDEG